MSNFEIISIFLSMLNIVVMIVGLFFAYKQLKANYEIKLADYKWNQRVEAKHALREYRNLSVDLLVSKFDFLNRKDSIPLQDIEMAISENKQIQKQLHDLLNFYEGLASGIQYEIYDEDIIKNARKGNIKRIFRSFRLFIEARQDKFPTAWIEFSNLVKAWELEDKKANESKSPSIYNELQSKA